MRRRRYRRPEGQDTQDSRRDSDWSIPTLDERKPSSHRDDMSELFAPLPDERGGYAAPSGGNRGPMILVLAIGVLLIFGVVVYNAYRQGVRQGDRSQLPQIASEGAFKSAPLDPGGRASENVDKQVLSQVDGEGRGDEDITPAIVREEPVPMGVEKVAASDDPFSSGLASKPPRDPFDDPFARSGSDSQPSAPSTGGTADTSGGPVDLRSHLQIASGEDDSGAADAPPVRQVAEVTTPPPPRVTLTPKPAPVRSDPVQKPTPAPSVASASGAGAFVVQLASVRSREAAEAEWSKASARAPSLITNAHKSVTTVDLGDKGVWHRVRAGAFDSRATAAAFCDAYKAAGGDCFVTAR